MRTGLLPCGPWESKSLTKIPGGAMRIHGDPMGIPWGSMRIHAHPWGSHAVPCGPMRIHGAPMRIHGDPMAIPWRSHAHPCGPVRSHAHPCASMEIPWRSHAHPWQSHARSCASMEIPCASQEDPMRIHGDPIYRTKSPRAPPQAPQVRRWAALVVDEVSMLSAEFLDLAEAALRRARRVDGERAITAGGLQVTFSLSQRSSKGQAGADARAWSFAPRSKAKA